MTQAAFAAAVGAKTTHTRVSEWEKDKVEPETGTLGLIARAARERYDIDAVFTWLQQGGDMPPPFVYGRIRGQGEEGAESQGGSLAVRERPGPASPAGGELSLAADAAQSVAGQIALTRFRGRESIPVGEVLDFLMAVVDAAAGRPIKLPNGPEKPGGASHAGHTETG